MSELNKMTIITDKNDPEFVLELSVDGVRLTNLQSFEAAISKEDPNVHKVKIEMLVEAIHETAHRN